MSNVSQQTFWAILCIGFCVATPRILTSDHSCSCHSTDECSGKTELFSTISQVPMLPCEGEHLIRCCTVITKSKKPIEANRFLQNFNTEDQLAEESEIKEKLIEESTTLMENLTSDTVTYTDESFEEYLTTDAQTSTPLEEIFSPTTQIPTDSGIMNANDEADRNASLLNTTENIRISVNPMQTLTSSKPSFGRRRSHLRYLNSTQFSDTRPTRVGIINERTTTLPSVARFRRPEKPMRQQKVKEETPEGTLIAGEEKLIDQAIRFESTKILKASRLNERFARELKGMTKRTADSYRVYPEN